MKIVNETNILDKILHHLGKTNKNTFLVQIGAMDGQSYDDVVGHIRMYDWSGLYVEPISYYFYKLVRCKKETDLFEQSAIVEQNGPVEMVTIDREPIESGKIHHGFSGMSAVWPPRNGFAHDYDKPVMEQYGKRIVVNGITLPTLFEKHQIDTFDIFLCDAEGLDWTVFKQLDLTKYRPKAIRLEYINLTEDEKQQVIDKLITHQYVYEISGQDIDAIPAEFWDEYVQQKSPQVTENLTVVTGLWNINRSGRDFTHYIEHFKKFLKIPANMFIYVPRELESLVWENRSPENTHVRILELDEIKHGYYAPFWEKTQQIRNDSEWLEQTGRHGWLKNSPQAVNEWYNPIVQSKMFMLHDAKIINKFNTDYFIWLDAGITNTVNDSYFTKHRCLDKIIPQLKTFLFLSYPYEANNEIHGFDLKAMNRFAREDVKYVCRGGLFGGHKDFLSQINSTYYHLLENTLLTGYMGTEESIFSIMAHREPHVYRRYKLDDNGLIVKFVQALLDDAVTLENFGQQVHTMPKGVYNQKTDKTSLYVLSFNFPQQFQTLIDSFEKHPEWITHPRKILINNSQDQDIIAEYDKICKQYNFEHIVTGENLGINRGRLFAAKHFHESDSDYYFFFEDDMCLHDPQNTQSCRNGFRHYVPNLYKTVHEIMAREEFDFLKLSYTEVYMDNNIQVSWYNVPQEFRTMLWPTYDKLPESGLDPYAPRTKFERIDVHNNLSYITGQIYYANWPMIVNKKGNYKMFLETEWAHPYEQTWMSHMFQETLKGHLTPAVLLASPINHNRICHYDQKSRREN